MGKSKKNNKEKRLEREKPWGFSSKGTGGYFVILSIIGILVGIWLILQGLGGNGLSPGITLLLGVFVVIKETLDIFH